MHQGKCLLFFAALMAVIPAAQSELPEVRQQQLVHLLRHDCGSCHGMTLKGGLGPSLLPGQIRSSDPAYLRQIITYGVPGSAMPPWQPLLSADDIDFLVETLIHLPAETD